MILPGFHQPWLGLVKSWLGTRLVINQRLGNQGWAILVGPRVSPGIICAHATSTAYKVHGVALLEVPGLAYDA